MSKQSHGQAEEEARGVVSGMPVVGRRASVGNVTSVFASPSLLLRTTKTEATFQFPLLTVWQKSIAAPCPTAALPAAEGIAAL